METFEGSIEEIWLSPLSLLVFFGSHSTIVRYSMVTFNTIAVPHTVFPITIPRSAKRRLDLRDFPLQACIEIAVGADAHVVIVDGICGKGRAFDRSIRIHVGRGAEVLFVGLLTSSSFSVHYEQRSIVEAGGKIHWWNATFGGKNVRHELVSEVMGDSGESTVDWVFLAQEEQHYDLNMRNIFHAPNGGGNVTMKGVVDDRAGVECHGAIVIGEEGHGTNTHLTQHILMLDASAKVDAVPALEIKTNDVKASHSATVTKVSDEDLFYMTSRGIERDGARRMLVEGFLGELIDRIPAAPLRKELMEMCGTIFQYVP